MSKKNIVHCLQVTVEFSEDGYKKWLDDKCGGDFENVKKETEAAPPENAKSVTVKHWTKEK